jgi:hypothetical protein
MAYTADEKQSFLLIYVEADHVPDIFPISVLHP